MRKTADRLAMHKAQAEKNAQTQAEQLKRYPNAAAAYLNQWPTDWRAVAKDWTRRAVTRARGNNGRPLEAYGFEHCRWIEDPERVGLRLVGYADELHGGIEHRGWYTDDDGHDETARGIVYQLPGRNGRARYVAGYADPYNDGPALLAFGADIVEGERLESSWDDDHDARHQIASYADSMAERMAEEARDYNRAWSYGQRAREYRDEMTDARTVLIEALKEHRQERGRESERPALCAMFRNWVKERLEFIRDRQANIAELVAEYRGKDGFAEGYQG